MYSMSKPENRRKWSNFLINPGFQLRLALIHGLLIVFMIVVIVAILLSPLCYEIQTTNELLSKYTLAQFMLHLMDRIVVAVLLIIIISTIYIIIFSHRLCGPLVNINHTLDSLSRGDLTRKVFLRRRDFLKPEAKKINSALASLNEKILMLKKIQIELSSMASQLPEEEAGNLVRSLLKQNQALLDEWKVIPGGSETKNT
jgi:methyl-accepting chemotaxis protein